LKEKPEDLIKIEDDQDAGTDADALRYSDHDQYADSSSSDNDEFEVELNIINRIAIYIVSLQFELSQRPSYKPQRSSSHYSSYPSTIVEQPCSSLQVCLMEIKKQ